MLPSKLLYVRAFPTLSMPQMRQKPIASENRRRRTLLVTAEIVGGKPHITDGQLLRSYSLSKVSRVFFVTQPILVFVYKEPLQAS